jgi:hypothetical protein
MVSTCLFVHVRSGSDATEATTTCDCMVHLLATSEKSAAFISGRGDTVSSPLSGSGLSLFFQASRDNLRTLWLSQMALNGDQCLALATMSPLDVELEIRSCRVSNAAAGAFVECLHTDRGPIKKLDQFNIDTGGRIVLTDDQKAHRTRLLAEMMQRNMTLHTIPLLEEERDGQIYKEEILPCLETNRYRQRVHAIRKVDISLRRPLLGLALQTESVRNDSKQSPMDVPVRESGCCCLIEFKIVRR